jgi:hypothetical protein
MVSPLKRRDTSGIPACVQRLACLRSFLSPAVNERRKRPSSGMTAFTD